MFQGFILPHRQTRISLRFVGLGLCLSFILFFFWHHPPASLLLLLLAAGFAWMRLEVAVALLPLTFPFYLACRHSHLADRCRFPLLSLA